MMKVMSCFTKAFFLNLNPHPNPLKKAILRKQYPQLACFVTGKVQRKAARENAI